MNCQVVSNYCSCQIGKLNVKHCELDGITIVIVLQVVLIEQ